MCRNWCKSECDNDSWCERPHFDETAIGGVEQCRISYLLTLDEKLRRSTEDNRSICSIC